MSLLSDSLEAMPPTAPGTDLIITTQDELPGPDDEAPYVLFVNETKYGNTRFLRANVLSARPDLKKYTSLRFRQNLKRHPDASDPVRSW